MKIKEILWFILYSGLRTSLHCDTKHSLHVLLRPYKAFSEEYFRKFGAICKYVLPLLIHTGYMYLILNTRNLFQSLILLHAPTNQQLIKHKLNTKMKLTFDFSLKLCHETHQNNVHVLTLLWQPKPFESERPVFQPQAASLSTCMRVNYSQRTSK